MTINVLVVDKESSDLEYWLDLIRDEYGLDNVYAANEMPTANDLIVTRRYGLALVDLTRLMI